MWQVYFNPNYTINPDARKLTSGFLIGQADTTKPTTVGAVTTYPFLGQPTKMAIADVDKKVLIPMVGFLTQVVRCDTLDLQGNVQKTSFNNEELGLPPLGVSMSVAVYVDDKQ